MKVKDLLVALETVDRELPQWVSAPDAARDIMEGAAKRAPARLTERWNFAAREFSSET